MWGYRKASGLWHVDWMSDFEQSLTLGSQTQFWAVRLSMATLKVVDRKGFSFWNGLPSVKVTAVLAVVPLTGS